jgi:hypothetical protein
MQQLQWIEIAFSAGAEECAAATGIADLRRLGCGSSERRVWSVAVDLAVAPHHFSLRAFFTSARLM